MAFIGGLLQLISIIFSYGPLEEDTSIGVCRNREAFEEALRAEEQRLEEYHRHVRAGDWA